MRDYDLQINGVSGYIVRGDPTPFSLGKDRCVCVCLLLQLLVSGVVKNSFLRVSFFLYHDQNKVEPDFVVISKSTLFATKTAAENISITSRFFLVRKRILQSRSQFF